MYQKYTPNTAEKKRLNKFLKKTKMFKEIIFDEASSKKETVVYFSTGCISTNMIRKLKDLGGIPAVPVNPSFGSIHSYLVHWKGQS